MPFTNSNFRALQLQSKKYAVSVGESLFAEVYPKSGRYFVWRHLFPPGKEGKLRDYQIGPYGKGPGQWSLKASEDLSWAFMRNPHQISLGPNHPHLTSVGICFCGSCGAAALLRHEEGSNLSSRCLGRRLQRF